MEFEPQVHAVRGWCPKCESAQLWTKTERRYQRFVQRAVGLRVEAGIEASYICEKCSYITQENPDALVPIVLPGIVPPSVVADKPVVPVKVEVVQPVITEADLKAEMNEIDARIRRALNPTD